jgi:hypothetical protein
MVSGPTCSCQRRSLLPKEEEGSRAESNALKASGVVKEDAMNQERVGDGPLLESSAADVFSDASACFKNVAKESRTTSLDWERISYS